MTINQLSSSALAIQSHVFHQVHPRLSRDGDNYTGSVDQSGVCRSGLVGDRGDCHPIFMLFGLLVGIWVLYDEDEKANVAKSN